MGVSDDTVKPLHVEGVHRGVDAAMEVTTGVVVYDVAVNTNQPPVGLRQGYSQEILPGVDPRCPIRLCLI